MTEVPPAQSTAARVISGRYRLECELGRGGAGAAYRAIDRTNGRVVALKTLERNTPQLLALFEREYHTLASLKHPRVIEVYDFGIGEQDQRYYTMELLPGKDLVDLAPLPWQEACRHAPRRGRVARASTRAAAAPSRCEPAQRAPRRHGPCQADRLRRAV